MGEFNNTEIPAGSPDNILLALAIIGLVSPLIAIFQQDAVFENVSELLSIAIEVAFFYDYVKYAKAVAKEN